MKSETLHDLWSSPDNTRLISKQFSFRLPVHIAAKIAALCELYPQKNRTQIVADLLTTALDDLEQKLPYKLHELSAEEQYNEKEAARHFGYEYKKLYRLGGAREKYRSAVNKNFKQFEKELGNDSPTDIYEKLVGSEEYFQGDLK